MKNAITVLLKELSENLIDKCIETAIRDNNSLAFLVCLQEKQSRFIKEFENA